MNIIYIRLWLASIFILTVGYKTGYSQNFQVVKFLTGSSYNDTTYVYLEKLWPKNIDSSAEISESKKYSISGVYQRHDTLLIASTSTNFFEHDDYEIASPCKILERYRDHSVTLSIAEFYPPDYAFITTEYGDSLKYLGNWSSAPISLSYAILKSNTLLTISEHLKIGNDVKEVLDFIGLSKLGLHTLFEDQTSGVIVISNKAKEHDYKFDKSISSTNFSTIFIEIVDGRIRSIRLDDYPNSNQYI